MLSCSKCGMQYSNETSRCEVCNILLVDSLPQKPAIKDDGSLDLVELASFVNVSEAEMVQELLEQNEIETIVQGEIDPIGIASRAESTKLLVEKKDLAQAQELYNMYFAGDATEGDESDQE
jgi:hypothetical protein